jgi:glycosyltransferase involved in cell wall biosynthesis
LAEIDYRKHAGEEFCRGDAHRRLKICWVGGALYRRPLNRTQEKKFNVLSVLGELFVIGSAYGICPTRFQQYANFYLLPHPSYPALRYLITYPLTTILVSWLAFRKDVRIFVGQSPYESLPAAFVKRLAALLGRQITLVVESHGDFEKFIFLQRRVWFPRFYNWLIRQSAKFVFRHTDALRAVSDSTRQQLLAWAPTKPLTRFVAWTDIDVFLSTPRQVKASESNVIVYAGVLVPGKAVHLLIEAFGRVAQVIPGASLLLIGRPENRKYNLQLREQVDRLDLGNRVTIKDEMSQQELAHHLGSARVLVLPSTSEALGLVILEAMACGTPVIGTRVGGIPDLIEDGVNGYLVPAGDIDALADRIRTLLSSDEVDAMGQQGREMARGIFSPNSYLEGYRRLFDLALKKADEEATSNSLST